MTMPVNTVVDRSSRLTHSPAARSVAYLPRPTAATAQGGLDNAASKAAIERASDLAARAPDPEFDGVRLSNAAMLAAVFGKLDDGLALLKTAEASPRSARGERSVQAFWTALARTFLASQRGDGATGLAAGRETVVRAEACLARRGRCHIDRNDQPRCRARCLRPAGGKPGRAGEGGCVGA